MKTHIIILAGGKGKRMNSQDPKVLTQLAGRTFLDRVLEVVVPICSKPTIVVGYKADEVIAATGNRYSYALQQEQLGTAHAVICAKKSVAEDIDTLVVLNGDHPLIRPETIKKLLSSHEASGAPVTMGSTIVPHFEGDFVVFADFGRVIRNTDGRVDRIIEVKDASDLQKSIKEVNLNYYCFQPQWLWDYIGLITNDNKAQEYYLTDIVKIASQQGMPINCFVVENPVEGMGVNSAEQLAIVEKYA